MHKSWYIVRITSSSEDPKIIKSFWDRATAYRHLIREGLEWNENFHVMNWGTFMAVQNRRQTR